MDCEIKTPEKQKNNSCLAVLHWIQATIKKSISVISGLPQSVVQQALFPVTLAVW